MRLSFRSTVRTEQQVISVLLDHAAQNHPLNNATRNEQSAQQENREHNAGEYSVIRSVSARRTMGLGFRTHVDRRSVKRIG
jgi:hypothetical protein